MKTKRPPKPIRKRQRPMDGWHIIGVKDMEDVDPLGLELVHCEVCGQALRFVHVLGHPDWDERMNAGAGCADRLCGKDDDD